MHLARSQERGRVAHKVPLAIHGAGPGLTSYRHHEWEPGTIDCVQCQYSCGLCARKPGTPGSCPCPSFSNEPFDGHSEKEEIRFYRYRKSSSVAVCTQSEAAAAPSGVYGRGSSSGTRGAAFCVQPAADESLIAVFWIFEYLEAQQ